MPYIMIGTPGDSVRWEPSEFVTDPKSDYTVASIPNTTVFQYTVYDTISGCHATDAILLTTYPKVDIDIFDATTGTPLDTVTYLSQGSNFYMHATLIGFRGYTWEPDQWIQIVDGNAVISPVEDITYKVYGQTENLCIETDSIHVVIRRPMIIYSGFSPNGDAFNPVWVIENAEQWGDKIHVRVFNRWGELIFESKGYGGNKAWDGTRNGRLMPVGSYYYIVDIKDGISKPYTGTVTILR